MLDVVLECAWMLLFVLIFFVSFAQCAEEECLKNPGEKRFFGSLARINAHKDAFMPKIFVSERRALYTICEDEDDAVVSKPSVCSAVTIKSKLLLYTKPMQRVSKPLSVRWCESEEELRIFMDDEPAHMYDGTPISVDGFLCELARNGTDIFFALLMPCIERSIKQEGVILIKFPVIFHKYFTHKKNEAAESYLHDCIVYRDWIIENFLGSTVGQIKEQLCLHTKHLLDEHSWWEREAFSSK